MDVVLQAVTNAVACAVIAIAMTVIVVVSQLAAIAADTAGAVRRRGDLPSPPLP